MSQASSALPEMKPNEESGREKPSNSDQEIETATTKEGRPRNTENLSSSHESNTESPEAAGGTEEGKSKPSKVKELWSKLGLDIGTALMMFKWVQH